MPSTIYNNFKTALLAATTKEHREEIMGLKFGCQIKRFNNIVDTFIDLKIYDGKEKDIYLVYLKTRLGDIIKFESYIKEIESWEIIGRPLTLEDVAIALNKKIGSYFVNFTSGFIGYWYFDNDGYLLDKITDIQWLLGKPADQQTDECLIKLTELLK